MAPVFSVSLNDVHAAASRICGHVIGIQLLENELLNRALGFRLLVKAECLQPTHSFKIRGATNQILQLTDEEKAKGVVAFSSGNHASAVARAAWRAGVAATILMPHDPPPIKSNKTRAYGAKIVTYNRETEDRYVIGEKLLRAHGGRLIHSYDDARTVAGQGTVGLEIAEELRSRGVVPDAIIVNCCGGGLAAGTALTLPLYQNPPALFTAEPEDFDDSRRSLASGTLMENVKKSGSICDALMMPKMGEENFAILRHYGAQGLVASDDDAQAAMSLASEYFGLTLEPGGAVGLACACLNRERFQGQTVIVIASGGNVQPERYPGMLERGQLHRARLLPQLMS